MESLLSVITALMLLTAFMFLIQNRINSMIGTFICQSSLLAVAMFLHAIKNSETDLYLSAILTIVLKVIFIPYLLKYYVRKLNVRHRVTTVKRPFLLLLGAAALVLFCYRLIIPIDVLWTHDNNTIAVAMAVMLLGMLLLITHRKAISHVIGFMSMENGIFFAALVATKGMPILVEIGVVFDVLVASLLFGIFFLQLRRSIDSLDVDRLNLLREDVE
jgi:hydrogenase-4 component E